MMHQQNLFCCEREVILKKDNRNACAVKTSIGGQALMEGIMMRGPKKTAMAVRNPKGEMVIEEIEPKAANRPKICKLPLVRGIFGFIDSMALGYKCLMRSAEISGLEELEEEERRAKKAKKAAKAAKKAEKKGIEISTESDEASPEENSGDGEKKKSSAMTTVVMVISLILSLALVLGLFIFLPNFIGTLILGENAATEHPIWLSVISGAIKVVLLVSYMALVSLMKDIRRTFMYHGAEHKTIFCYEQGLELTVENVRKQKRFHPRCGTSFLILMMLVGMVIMIAVSYVLRATLPAEIINNKIIYIFIRCACTLVLLPLIMGIGYELIKLAGKYDNWFIRIISAPGMWLQRITTVEPDDDMIECAIIAIEKVIPDDGSDKIG